MRPGNRRDGRVGAYGERAIVHRERGGFRGGGGKGEIPGDAVGLAAEVERDVVVFDGQALAGGGAAEADGVGGAVVERDVLRGGRDHVRGPLVGRVVIPAGGIDPA